ncbi:tetratricopeptide repeat protein [Labrys monachus]|uniref:Tetratricopeptide (TPR) repeat protein n=1 Tax=Labrys monachus TaxID=217067 RepID=A0ABU0F8S5_9HYPH|nr:tetratricopeptide repeat protein [Labrys monachus]MDQ0390450.1 tetratricopeptide (TPR) repeat protein [Labrys monachus]
MDKPRNGDPAVMTVPADPLQGRPHEARALLQRSLAARPDHVPTWLAFGRLARRMGNDAEALAAFERAFHLAPASPEPAFLLCAALLRAGNPRAQAMLGMLLARFPQEAGGWEELGDALLKLDKLEAALVCFMRAGEAAPSFASAMRRGLVLRELGRAGEAAIAFEQAVTLDPTSSRGWFLLGASLQDARNLGPAAAAYREALAVDPALVEAVVNLGTVLQEMGDLEAAKAAYGEAVRMHAPAFGRIAQAMTSSPKGELWLDLAALRHALVG